jgi:hypothetical protein
VSGNGNNTQTPTMPYATIATRTGRQRLGGPRYDFDKLRHGDAIEGVQNKASAREMFRRWKRLHGRYGRLVSGKGGDDVLYFLDETPV